MIKSEIAHRKPKSWYKITVETPANDADTVASFLGTISENGIEQSATLSTDPQPIEYIIAYIDNDVHRKQKTKNLHSFLSKINQKYSNEKPVKYTEDYIIEQDWNLEWKKHFKPFNLTERLIIKPSWEPYTAKPNEKILEMDPGMAFGTGLHASTQLALLLIEKIYSSPQPPNSVLDVGTGTGILAMGCALLGSQKIIALDNDIDARVAALDNVQKNNLENRVIISEDDLQNISGEFDLVIANITQDILIDLSQSLFKSTVPAGHLVLSGILAFEQAANIKGVFSSLGFIHHASEKKEEWESMCFKKPNRN